ncbi:MAG: MFS transporter [Microbacteriaceae bacterium]|nr:MFS transporter [Microbacteriaceae bacterium]
MSDDATPGPATTGSAVPATANTGAIPALGLDRQEGKVIPRKQVFSWALWDWATQPFNTVILTFIFVALYLTGDDFLPAAAIRAGEGSTEYERAAAGLTSTLGLGVAAAGLFIGLLAPVLGRRSDTGGGRKRWLAFSTGLLVLLMAALFFVRADPAYFLLGVGLVAVGTVVSEIAGVNYNAMLVSVSTPKTVGKVSGTGWGFGYIGGILALVIVVVANQMDWFGLSTDDGLPYRVIALGCALWTILFSIPLFLNVPDVVPEPGAQRSGFLRSYLDLGRDLVRLQRELKPTFWFLLASAVFRDGLAGVFTFGAVIAARVFGFEFLELVVFGIAANLIAGVSTIVSGRFDDRFGPRAVIVTSLIGLVAAGLAVFLLHDAGAITFWIGGLILCAFVGPAQAAARSFLARVTPAGREGEIFGLYATTGRAASFLSPLLWAGFIVALGATFWGILGIVLVLLAGLVLVLLIGRTEIVPTPADGRTDSGLAGLAAFLSVVLSSGGWIVYLGVAGVVGASVLIPLSLIGLALGVAALIRVRRRGEHGRPFALAASVIGGLSTVGAIAAVLLGLGALPAG